MSARDPQLHALILAAGASRRFGTPKQRATINGQPLLRRCVERTAEAVDHTWVILGAHAVQLTPLLTGLPVTIRTNRDWALGLGHSIRTGIEALPASCTGVMLVLADQARIRVEDYRRLADTWRRAPETIAAARYGSVTGAPVIIPRHLFHELAQLNGDVGARAVIQRHEHDVTAVPIPNATFDLDTPEDLMALISAESRR